MQRCRQSPQAEAAILLPEQIYDERKRKTQVKMQISKTLTRAAVAVLAFAIVGVAAAQSPTAAIQGTVTPGDVAIIHNVDTGFTREVKADAKGRYRLRNLPLGTFNVTIKHADGSFGISQNVTLRVGTTARVP
jgi:hypothetical protein